MKKVLITGGDGDIAKEISEKLQQLEGYEIRTPGRKELDVTSIEQAEDYISKWTPDILINNAGYVVPQSIAGCDIEKTKQSIDVNLFGTFNCTAAVLKRNRKAQVINIGSSAATKVHGTWSAYCAAKAAVVMATQCWADDGIDCICISPGRTATKMRKGLFPTEDQSTLMSAGDFAKVVVNAIQGRYPSGGHLNVNVDNISTYLK